MRLFEFEIRWAKVAFGTILPDDSALPHGIASLAPEKDLADAIRTAPIEQALGLRLALWLVALAPVVLLRRPRSIVGLTPALRESVIERLLASSIYPVRQLALAFKAFAALLYARSPVARAFMAGGERGAIPIPLESGFVTLRTKGRATPAPAGLVPAPESSGVLPTEANPSFASEGTAKKGGQSAA